MKKIFIFVVCIAIFCVLAQIFSAFLGARFIDGAINELAKKVEISDVSVQHGFFRSDAEFIIKQNNEFGELAIKIKAWAKYFVLPNFSVFEGNASAANSLSSEQFQIIFSNQTPLKFTAKANIFGDLDILFELAPAEFGPLNTKTAGLRLGVSGGKIKSADLELSKAKTSFYNIFGTYDIEFSGINLSSEFENGVNLGDFIDAKAQNIDISIGKISSKVLQIELSRIDGAFSQNTKNNDISSLAQVKIAELKIFANEIKKVALKLVASGLDAKNLEKYLHLNSQENWLNLLRSGSKIDEFALDLQNKDGKKIAVNSHAELRNPEKIVVSSDIAKSLDFSGKFKSDERLSDMIPLLSALRYYEDKMLSNGALIKKSDGYECEFTLSEGGEDLIFNAKTSLRSIF